jgi:PAS domain-containing protein
MKVMPKRDYSEPDYRVLFERLPALCLVLDATFTIIAQNDAHARATHTRREDVVGHHLFEVFPDNPNVLSEHGLDTLRASLLRVLKTKAPDRMRRLKYDIENRRSGAHRYEERYWDVLNIPILGDDGYVKWILNSASDVTEAVALEARANGGRKKRS